MDYKRVLILRFTNGMSSREIEYSAFPEPGVRRVGATIPVDQSQCSGR